MRLHRGPHQAHLWMGKLRLGEGKCLVQGLRA